MSLDGLCDTYLQVTELLTDADKKGTVTLEDQLHVLSLLC